LLEAVKEKLIASDCQLVIIGYGNVASANSWKNDVSGAFDFPVYLDIDRVSYTRFGMKRDFSKVCQSSAVFKYVEDFLIKKVPKPFGNNHYEGDDPIQNGGDIIFNKNGEMVYEHLGNAASRPGIEDVLKFLSQN